LLVSELRPSAPCISVSFRLSSYFLGWVGRGGQARAVKLGLGGGFGGSGVRGFGGSGVRGLGLRGGGSAPQTPLGCFLLLSAPPVFSCQPFFLVIPGGCRIQPAQCFFLLLPGAHKAHSQFRVCGVCHGIFNFLQVFSCCFHALFIASFVPCFLTQAVGFGRFLVGVRSHRNNNCQWLFLASSEVPMVLGFASKVPFLVFCDKFCQSSSCLSSKA